MALATRRVVLVRDDIAIDDIAISWPAGAKTLEPCNTCGSADLGNFPIPPVPASRAIQVSVSSSANASHAGVFGRKLGKARSSTRTQI